MSDMRLKTATTTKMKKSFTSVMYTQQTKQMIEKKN